MKNCPGPYCKTPNPKPKSDFYKNKNKPDGLTIHCKDCSSEFCRRANKKNRERNNQQRREYRARNRAAMLITQRRGWLRREYGITIEQYDEMFNAQGGCCSICKTSEEVFQRRLHVDHCHRTGKVRALLCTNCNQLLGAALESEDRLLAAVEYLRRF